MGAPASLTQSWPCGLTTRSTRTPTGGASRLGGRRLPWYVRPRMGIDVIYDNLDSTGEAPIVIEATVTLLPQYKGGKSRPITKGYRPNHNFGRTENRTMYIGQIELREGEFMHPGETRDVCVTFLNVR